MQPAQPILLIEFGIISPVDIVGELLTFTQTHSSVLLIPMATSTHTSGLAMALAHEASSRSLTDLTFVNNMIEAAPSTPALIYMRLSIAWIESPQPEQGNEGTSHPYPPTFVSHPTNQSETLFFAVGLLPVPMPSVPTDAHIASPLRQALTASSLIYEGLCLLSQALLAEGAPHRQSRNRYSGARRV